jgi:hypothetical protein
MRKGRWITLAAALSLLMSSGCVNDGIVDKSIRDKAARDEKKGKPRLETIRLVSDGSAKLTTIGYATGTRPGINAFTWEGTWKTTLIVRTGTEVTLMVANRTNEGFVRCRIYVKVKILIIGKVHKRHTICSYIVGFPGSEQ